MITDLTKGSVAKKLAAFSLPFIFGNLFQLTYNAVDSIIVGKFAGIDALAAVGSANPVMTIAILGINGICIGASVLMSESYGAGKYGQLKKATATLFLFGIIFSFVFMVAGLFAARPLLWLLHVPGKILDHSTHYLQIIMLGIPFTYAYNALAAAMRSVGDSKSPVRFLAFASILNGFLDYIFIRIFHLGVTGCAVATVIAEAVSAICCLVYVYRRIPVLKLRLCELRIDGPVLKKTLQYGSVTALQQSCQPIGKLLIQGVVNSLGVGAIAVFHAVCRVDDFALTPEQSISHGMMTFTAQNRGAEKDDRVRQGLKKGLLLEFGFWILIGTLAFLIRKPVMKLFINKEEKEMIALGMRYIALMSVMYLLPAMTNGLQGYFRGMGRMKVTLLSTLIQISCRVILVWLFMPTFGLTMAAVASAVGWVFMILFEGGYYVLTDGGRKQKRHAD